MRTPATPKHEQGAVLLIALVMLLLISMASIATIRTTTLDERMAGNSRDRDRALQAADAAIRTCLKQLTVDVPPSFTGTILTPVASGAQNWEIAANWQNASSVEIAIANAELASNPRCMVERLGVGDNYRVTGWAVGGSDTSVVILQATHSMDY